MKLRIIVLLFIPAAALAQDLSSISESDMAAMMQKVQQMQSCMATVDQDELKLLERRSQQIHAEMQSLCTGGQRDEAQKKALSFSKEIAQSSALKTITKCGEGMGEMMPQIFQMKTPEEYSEQHVCDTL